MPDKMLTSVILASLAALSIYLLFNGLYSYLSSYATTFFVGRRAGSVSIHSIKAKGSKYPSLWLPAVIRNFTQETSLADMATLICYCSVLISGFIVAILVVDGLSCVALATLGAGIGVPYMVLRRNRLAARAVVREGLPSALTLLAGALSAGMSLGQSLAYAAGRLPGSLGRHFGEIARQQELGIEFDESLRRLRTQLDLPELDNVLVGVAIQRRTGGDLAGVLEHMANIVKQKLLLQRMTRVMTAQARFSGRVIGMLPVAVTILILVVDPTFLTPMLSTLPGWTMLMFAFLSEVMGFAIIGRIASIDV